MRSTFLQDQCVPFLWLKRLPYAFFHHYFTTKLFTPTLIISNHFCYLRKSLFLNLLENTFLLHSGLSDNSTNTRRFSAVILPPLFTQHWDCLVLLRVLSQALQLLATSLKLFVDLFKALFSCSYILFTGYIIYNQMNVSFLILSLFVVSYTVCHHIIQLPHSLYPRCTKMFFSTSYMSAKTCIFKESWGRGAFWPLNS